MLWYHLTYKVSNLASGVLFQVKQMLKDACKKKTLPRRPERAWIAPSTPAVSPSQGVIYCSWSPTAGLDSDERAEQAA
jgi:hypothetical protein